MSRFAVESFPTCQIPPSPASSQAPASCVSKPLSRVPFWWASSWRVYSASQLSAEALQLSAEAGEALEGLVCVCRLRVSSTPTRRGCWHHLSDESPELCIASPNDALDTTVTRRESWIVWCIDSLKSVVTFSMTRNTWLWNGDTCFCVCHDLGFGSQEPEAEIKSVERNLTKPNHRRRCL